MDPRTLQAPNMLWIEAIGDGEYVVHGAYDKPYDYFGHAARCAPAAAGPATAPLVPENTVHEPETLTNPLRCTPGWLAALFA